MLDEVKVNVIITPEDLRSIANEAIKLKENIKEVKTISADKIDKIISEVVEVMLISAKEGKMECSYSFGKEPRELMEKVSNELREMYPQNMRITKLGGTNMVVLNWSGKNDC